MSILQQKTTESLFELQNLSNLIFDYKLVPLEISRISQEEDLYFSQTQKAVKLLASKIGGPATLLRKDDKQYIAIPADLSFDEFVIKAKPSPVRLKLPSEIYHIRFEDSNEQEFDMIIKLLDFSIRQQIKKSGRLIEEGTGRFIFKSPLKGFENNSIDLLHGFTFRLIPDGKTKVYLSLDITYRYLDKYCLSHYMAGKDIKSSKKILLGNNSQTNFGSRYLYEMGDYWFPIEVFLFSDKTISTELFDDKETGKTVSLQEYLIRKTKFHKNKIVNRIKPDDLVVYYKYPGRKMDYLSAPASLIRRIYKSDEQKIGRLQKETIKEISERFYHSERRVKNEFMTLTYNQKPLNIKETLLDSNLTAFALKDLKCRGEQVIKGLIPKNGNVVPNDNYARQRKNTIQNVGVLNNSSLEDTQYLLIPNTINFPKGVQNIFREQFEKKAKQLCPEFTTFKKVVYYHANKDSVRDLVEEVAQSLEREGISEGTALIILPHWGSDDLKVSLFHDFVKYRFKNQITFQCANSDKIRSFFELNEDREYSFENESVAKNFSAYLFNLVLEYLKINGRFPYTLSESPNYDIYVGIDVHQQYAAFSFFYRNGKHITIKHTEIPRPPSGTRYEKLTEKQVYNVIYEVLKRQIPRYCENPNAIIIIRDGCSNEEGEYKALGGTIKQLHKDNIIANPELPYAVVDLHKKSQIPYRVGSRGGNQRQYELPLAGTYKLFGRNYEQAFLFPTGFPFRIRGSAKPIQFILKNKTGHIEFEKILEDMFGQCLLAFSAPDLPNSLPIIIKMLDDYLQPFGYSQKRLNDAENERISLHEEEDYDDEFDSWDDSFQLINTEL